MPEILQGKTSGTYLPTAIDFVRAQDLPPYDHIPAVGSSGLEPVLDADGRPIRGEFYSLADNGYGRSELSADYALHLQHLRISKSFSYRHGEHLAPVYTPVEEIQTVILHDPHGFVFWKNQMTGELLDIQVEYAVPDDWTEGDNNFQFFRALTGRDLDPEGLAVISETCALIGEEFGPSIFTINPKTGVVQSELLQIPDILPDLNITSDRMLTTVSDKQHCTLAQLQANTCGVVEEKLIDEQGSWGKEKGKGGERVFVSKFKRIDLGEGIVSLALLNSGYVAAFLESRIDFEAGIRVYQVYPGDCTKECPPQIKKFWGFYRTEANANAIAAVTPIPGHESRVLVLERNFFPFQNSEFPLRVMPADLLCLVDLAVTNEDGVFTSKRCFLNLQHISDPYDVDQNGVFVYGQTQRKNEGLVVLDDYCFMIGTDTDYPFTNTLELPFDIPFYQEVTDGRFIMICFLERIFDSGFPHFL